MLRCTGRVLIEETGHGLEVRVLMSQPGSDAVLAEADADLDGRYQFNYDGSLEPGTSIRLSVAPKGCRDPDKAIHHREIPAPGTLDLHQIDIAIPRADFERAGIPTRLDWSIKCVQFSDGTSVDLQPGSLILIVGANSSGKTCALREISAACRWAPVKRRRVTKTVELAPERPSQGLLRNWIRSNYPIRAQNGLEIAEFSKAHLQVAGLTHNDQTAQFLVFLLDIEERLQLSHAQQFSTIENAPQNLVDHIFRRDDLMSQLGVETRAAFGTDLLQEIAPQIGFRVGDASTLPKSDRASGEFRLALQSLPKLVEAGDGIRSFVGTLLALTACPHLLLLVDEPEAFLHPPQARIVGRKLAEASNARQIIAATHSADVVLGALSVAGANVQIIRVHRSGDHNGATSLAPAAVQEVARDPQWESTELLGSMFHVGAVLCEADADRRFYRWLAEEVDLAFVACNGKGGLAKAAGALSKLGVPSAIVADFDVLGNEGELRAIILALEHDPDKILDAASRYQDIRRALSSGKVRTVEEISADLTQALQDAAQGKVERGPFLKRVAEIVESSKSGYEAKKHGINKFTGELHVACRQLLEQLSTAGLFVVSRGELEGWWREGASDKKQWIVEAWERARSDPDAFVEARQFMRAVTSYVRAAEKS